ncbi:hypothetical protein AAKU58_000325 [Oxalobacteraceae bacterium GrIS 1.18]
MKNANKMCVCCTFFIQLLFVKCLEVGTRATDKLINVAQLPELRQGGGRELQRSLMFSCAAKTAGTTFAVGKFVYNFKANLQDRHNN